MNADDTPTTDPDDTLLHFVEEPPPAAPADPGAWRVLVVDDDDDVHLATEIAMRDVQVEGRRLQFLHARSSAEAMQMLAADDGIAVLLLDVVMETPDAGLRLVRRARRELGRVALRIILRTGQPGYAPEIETLRDHDINDYRTKSELTRARLFSSLATAIRSFAQLTELMRLNAELERARAAERQAFEQRLAAEARLREVQDGVEQCVAERTRELSQVVNDLDAFNRMVSHDLSGPLHGLASMAGLLQGEFERGNLDRVRQWLSTMEGQTRRLAELVGELLVLSRTSKVPLLRAPAELADVVGDALHTLAIGGTDVSAVVVGPLPRLAVDVVLLRQVFVNLLANAIKFSREVVAPRVQVTARQEAGGWIVSVSDNGVGFDPSRAGDLFKPFARLHEARYGGSGIGLTIVRRVVERHEGRVWAEALPAGGAAFHFSLPQPSSVAVPAGAVG